MIQINEKTGKINIGFDGNAETLMFMRYALIELMRNYDHGNCDASSTRETFISALDLLQLITPGFDGE